MTLASGSGNVFLDANSGNTSISLGSTAIRGKAPTVALCAGVGVGLGHQASAADACTTSTSNDGPGTAGFGQAGGHLILTAKAAMLGSPANASIEARDEVLYGACRITFNPHWAPAIIRIRIVRRVIYVC